MKSKQIHHKIQNLGQLRIYHNELRSSKLVCDKLAFNLVLKSKRTAHVKLKLYIQINQKVETMSSIKRWDAVSILSNEPMVEPYAFIVLNRPISFEAQHFQRLWNNGLNKYFLLLKLIYFKFLRQFSVCKSISATIRVLVDGGANHWFEFIAKNNLVNGIENPHYLTGDMDSITNESSERLKTMNCQQISTPDQMDTDCTKSIIAIQPYLEPQKVNTHIGFISNFLNDLQNHVFQFIA